jgi:hypothetical protein
MPAPCRPTLVVLSLTALACSSGQGAPAVPAIDATADASAPADAAPDLALDAPRPPADPLGVGMTCQGTAGERIDCAAGLLCCQPCCDGRPAVCTMPVQNSAGIGVGKCPLPDLTVDATALKNSLGFGPLTVSPSSCEAREQCVNEPGRRDTLHFEVTTPNLGTADLVLGSPLGKAAALGSGFLFSRCHQHYHFAGYALYQLIDGAGHEVVRGNKRAFCLEDFGALETFPLPRRHEPRYDCNYQGISVGWADTYYNGLSCQYMDLTGVPAGHYTLRVTVNPDRIFPELSYDNNVAEAPVDLQPLTGDPTQPCLGSVAGVNRECGWRSAVTAACTPGLRASAGCGLECGLGTAQGDPMIRVCPGDVPCPWPGLGNNDDCTPGGNVHGARVTFTCPASGTFTVLTGPAVSDETAGCDVELR